jgi:hypothetical protein
MLGTNTPDCPRREDEKKEREEVLRPAYQEEYIIVRQGLARVWYD